MDVLAFSQNISISHNDIDTIIREYFDELMAIYDLIGEYDNISISTEVSDSIISFDLVFINIENALGMKAICEISEISKYGHIYVPLVVHDSNILHIQLIDRIANKVSG